MLLFPTTPNAGRCGDVISDVIQLVGSLTQEDKTIVKFQDRIRSAAENDC